MGDEFICNAPLYMDFTGDNTEPPDDTYFDSAHPSVDCPIVLEDVNERELSDPESDMFFSPLDHKIPSAIFALKRSIRRSLSAGDIHQNKKTSATSEDLQCNLSKYSSQEHINRLAQPKRCTSDSRPTLAEAVKNFQAGTPKRFHSNPSLRKNEPWRATKAQSPKLKTTMRHRPLSVLSREEREKRELDEIKKFKIKAHPLNKKILKGPVKATVDVRPTTVVQPFNLTQCAKKFEATDVKKTPFTAQPVPRSLKSPFKVHPTSQPPTKGTSPSFSKRYSKPAPVKVDHKAEQPKFKPTPTELKPFSFEMRDQMIQKKKEEYIRRVLEEEKKAREFHARPLPKAILSSRNSSDELLSQPGSSKSHRSTEDLQPVNNFKAKPALVLIQQPFIPKKDDAHCLKIEAFQLRTDERVEARQKFEEKLKEKEAAIEAEKKAREEEARQLEEEMVAKLRKQMEVKAQPIKKFKEVKIETVRKVTIPISPKFHTDRIRNKENIEQ